MTTITVSKASGVTLDLLVAMADTRCSGLTFRKIKDVLCGCDGDGAGGVCIFIVGPAFRDQMKARTTLSLQHASVYCPTHDWSQGGPIIEKEHIRLSVNDDGQWWAETRLYADGRKAFTTSFDKAVIGQGLTPLIAAMRCFVASKLGDTVEVPEELL